MFGGAEFPLFMAHNNTDMRGGLRSFAMLVNAVEEAREPRRAPDETRILERATS